MSNKQSRLSYNEINWSLYSIDFSQKGGQKKPMKLDPSKAQKIEYKYAVKFVVCAYSIITMAIIIIIIFISISKC